MLLGLMYIRTAHASDCCLALVKGNLKVSRSSFSTFIGTRLRLFVAGEKAVSEALSERCLFGKNFSPSLT